METPPGPSALVLPFDLESDLEWRIAASPAWGIGMDWCESRRRHPAGSVKEHVAQVLAHLDRLALPAPTRARLRLAALVHDAFKYREDMSVPRVSPNEHGYLASQWLAPFVDDPVLLALLELHDEGYRAWRSARWGAEGQERVRLERLVARLPHDMNLYATFYWANNQTDGKDQSQLAWFARRLGDLGYELSPLPFRSFPVGRLAASPSSFFRQVFRQEFDHE